MIRRARPFSRSLLAFAVSTFGAAAHPAVAQAPYAGPQAEGDADLFGAWIFEVKSLARTETGVAPVTNSQTVCLKLGAKPADLPLMAKPLSGRCAMLRLEMRKDYVSMIMQCEDFDRRTSLQMYLEPRKDGAYFGRYDYSMALNDSGSAGSLAASAEVVARRAGGC